MKTRSTAATIVFSLLLIPSFAAYADDASSPDFNLVPLADKGKVDVHGLIRDSSINENHYIPPNSMEDSNNIASPLPPSTPQPTPKVSVIHSDMRDTAYCEWHIKHGRAAQPCPPSTKPSKETEETEPSSTEILYRALESVHIQGAGLIVQPSEWVYLGVPTLAHAQTNTIHTSVTIFDMEVPITLTATNFSFDFNNGAPPLHTTTPGQPWPSMDIYGIYDHETDNQTITLRTTWKGTATHPITGESITIQGMVTTVEESTPFKVKKRRIRLINNEEFNKL